MTLSLLALFVLVSVLAYNVTGRLDLSGPTRWALSGLLGLGFVFLATALFLAGNLVMLIYQLLTT